jgi:hypothetical protein
MLVEAVHPVPQCLPVHAADPHRLGADHSVMNCRQRQQPTRLIGILRLRRQPTQILGQKILPKSNRRAHLRPPESIQSGGK